MNDLRHAREKAFWLAWRKGLAYEPKRHLPALLDDLDRIDAEQPPSGLTLDGQPTEAAVAEFKAALAEAVNAKTAPEDHTGGPRRNVRHGRNQPKGNE